VQHFSTDALILRATPRGDHDKLLMVLAPKLGRFYAILKGAGSMRHREVAATEPYTLSNMEFYEKNGVKWVKNATAVETFPGIRADMDKLFLAAYIAEVAAELSDEREDGGEILPLTLNTLHKLSGSKGDRRHIKAVFEWRAATVAGFMPEVDRCCRCGGAVGDQCYLDVMGGAVICGACLQKASALRPIPEVSEMGERSILCPLTAAAAAAMDYVIKAEHKRIFSFELKDELSRDLFARATEAYLLHHLERGFPALESYKRLQAPHPHLFQNSIFTRTEDI